MLDIEALTREQAELWDGEAGQRWAADHERLDRLIRPLGMAAMERLAPAPGDAVIDVGCGFGATALELGRRVTSAGRVLGVDLSGAQLEVARASARAQGLAHLRFEHSDVTTYDFGGERFDGAFSRFGVMFFPDPIASFAHVRAALEPGSPLAFVCWQGLGDNEWMSVPLRAALTFVPPPAPLAPGAPGPFSFADATRVRGILEAAGFRDIDIEAGGEPVQVGSNAEDAAEWLLKMGACTRLLADTSDDLRARVADQARAALSDRETADGVRLGTSTWIVHARA
jgi:SAM-dependent methyltransferase